MSKQENQIRENIKKYNQTFSKIPSYHKCIDYLKCRYIKIKMLLVALLIITKLKAINAHDYLIVLS